VLFRSLVCVSVSVDQVEDRDKAFAFLKSRGAVFANYLLDEPPAVWQGIWDLNGPPLVLVYDRQGKQVGRFDADVDHTPADIERLVEKLLRPEP